MKDLIWKAAVTTLAILGCATLALRAGNSNATHATTRLSILAATPATSSASTTQFGLDTQCVSSVPRSWGQYRGGSSQAGLAFEASDGTLRFVTNLPCGASPVIALEVRRTPAASGNSSN
jgi:hypothetical protein